MSSMGFHLPSAGDKEVHHHTSFHMAAVGPYACPCVMYWSLLCRCDQTPGPMAALGRDFILAYGFRIKSSS